jgi:putative two-component system response regulator
MRQPELAVGTAAGQPLRLAARWQERADLPAGAPRILIVDDEEQNRALIGALVRALGYQVETARDGMDAIHKLELDVDAVLLDMSMPRMDGFEVMRRMREQERFRDVPVIAVTMFDSRADRLRALQAGANDFIAKPVERTELMVRLEAQLQLRQARRADRLQNLQLEEQVDRRTAQLRDSLQRMAEAERQAYDAQIATIRRLVLAAELKDPETGLHIVRLSLYSGILARALGYTPQQAEVLRHAITLHDVGKIGIPDAILRKPGALTPDERKVMESHTVIGARLLADSPSELLREGETIALSHHERWDGTGYPQGLAGEQIPLSGRICAVLDVFDALTTWRPYRAALPSEVAFDEVARGRGTHFDPALVDLFLAARDKVLAVHASLSHDPWGVAPVACRDTPGGSAAAVACRGIPGGGVAAPPEGTP